jgi:DNA-binding XRE family transcriptional regulator
MRILHEREVWVRVSNRRKPPLDRLTPEQHEGLRRAIEALRNRYGSLTRLARAVNVHPTTVIRAARVAGKSSPGLALKIARLVSVPVDDVLDGRFPKPGACPMCGRCD